MQALVVLLEEITEAEREGLVRWGAKGGADVLTGEGWALVGAAASRLAPLARSDRLPPGLERLAPELGRFLASYVDPPRRWALGGGSALDLDHPILIGIVNVTRSEEHTSELQSHSDLVCRLLLEKKKIKE